MGPASAPPITCDTQPDTSVAAIRCAISTTKEPSKQAALPGDTVIRHDSKKELDQPSANCTTHDSTIGRVCTRPVVEHVGWM